MARWRAALVNDFEKPIFEQYPAIRTVKEDLLEAGAGYAAMSGSGSAVFGVFETEEQAGAAAEAARRKGHRVWQGDPPRAGLQKRVQRDQTTHSSPERISRLDFVEIS